MRPKKRRFHTVLPDPEVNIVSMMDILTVLLFFLILFSFAKYAVVPAAGMPSYANAMMATEKPLFILQIIAKNDQSLELWLGPTKGLAIANPKTCRDYFSSGFKGNENLGFTRTLASAPKEGFQKRLEELLNEIHRCFPTETKAVLSSGDTLSYQRLIDVLSTVRQRFPEVLITELDSES